MRYFALLLLVAFSVLVLYFLIFDSDNSHKSNSLIKSDKTNSADKSDKSLEGDTNE